jgi:hypothetical protein
MLPRCSYKCFVEMKNSIIIKNFEIWVMLTQARAIYNMCKVCCPGSVQYFFKFQLNFLGFFLIIIIKRFGVLLKLKIKLIWSDILKFD